MTKQYNLIQSLHIYIYFIYSNICPACVGNMVIHSGKSYERSMLGLVAFHKNVIGPTCSRNNVRDPSQKGNMGASQNWDLKGMGIVFPTY